MPHDAAKENRAETSIEFPERWLPFETRLFFLVVAFVETNRLPTIVAD